MQAGLIVMYGCSQSCTIAFSGLSQGLKIQAGTASYLHIILNINWGGAEIFYGYLVSSYSFTASLLPFLSLSSSPLPFSFSLFLSFRLQEKCQAPSNLLLVLLFAAFTGVQH